MTQFNKSRARFTTGFTPGFTLVELLVVIGIIALLLAMLLPSLNKARQESNQVVCESNLRQIGTQMLIYADEHDGFLFPDKMGWDNQHVYLTAPGDGQVTFTNGTTTFAQDPSKYTYLTWPLNVFGVWNPPVFLCPTDLNPVGQHSYIVNEHMAYYNVKYSTVLPQGTSASNVVLAGEKTTTEGDYYMEYGDYAEGKVELHRHGFILGSNYLKLDMSVDILLPTSGQFEQALDPWDFNSGGPGPTTQSTN